MKMTWESFVFIGDEPCKTRYGSIVKGSFTLYSVDLEGEITKVYEEGKDYVVDYAAGVLRQTAETALPNFKTSVFYNKKDFNHAEEFTSNVDLTVFADYESAEEKESLPYTGVKLTRAAEKLKKTGRIDYLVFGDSISTGAEATKGLAYFERLKGYLEERYGGEVRITNAAISGETSVDGSKRFDAVLANDYDLVSIAYGTNDQCKLTENTTFTSFDTYKQTMESFIVRFQEKNPQADIFLIAPFEVNPKWHYKSGSIQVYCGILQYLAGVYGVGLADIYAAFEREHAAGKTPESLFRNNINHPNNYGHGVYFDVIKKLFE